MASQDIKECKDSLRSVLEYVAGKPGARPYTVGDLRRVLDYAKACLEKDIDPWKDGE